MGLFRRGLLCSTPAPEGTQTPQSLQNDSRDPFLLQGFLVAAIGNLYDKGNKQGSDSFRKSHKLLTYSKTIPTAPWFLLAGACASLLKLAGTGLHAQTETPQPAWPLAPGGGGRLEGCWVLARAHVSLDRMCPTPSASAAL